MNHVVINIPVESVITAQDRKRKSDSEKVKSLAHSILDIGLINPISIRPNYQLIAGLHRVDAYKLLGMLTIPAIVIDYESANDSETAELLAEIAEIDENLKRHNLTALQESIQHARRKVIYETLHPAAKRGALGGKGINADILTDNLSVRTDSYATDAATATGENERTVRRKNLIGERLEGFADQLEGTVIEDNQSDLLALSSLIKSNPEMASEVIDRLVADRDQREAESNQAVEDYENEQEEIDDELEQDDEATEETNDDLNDKTDDDDQVIVDLIPAKNSGCGRKYVKANKKQKKKTLPVKKTKVIKKSTPISVKGIVADIKKDERIKDIQQQADAIKEGNNGVPVGPFHVISIDPPWPYGTEYDPNGRRAANPYPEMSLEEIEALQLPAADDCVLWLWTTHKFMRHSFKLLDAWGFRDVAILTWAKDRMGLGTWLRSQSEFCIMAVKGKPPVNLTNQTTVINGPLREHSRKPDSFYDLVNSLCVGSKLDFFSREKREGWEQVGNTPELFEGKE